MRRTERQRRHGQRGTQIVEFAVVLPILIFLVMAVTEGAAFVRTHQVLNNAAREAARTAAAVENLNGWDPVTQQNSIAIQAACNYLRANSGAFVNWNPTSDSSCSDAAFTIQVTRLEGVDAPSVNGVAISASRAVVTYRYQLNMVPALPSVGLPNPLPLTGTAEFRNLY
jgi:Flp pilus assembly protein TadG